MDKSVFIAFTASATAQNSLFTNIYGELVRIVEGSGDGQGTTFTWQRWKAGGPNDASQAGHVFAAPDNLSFDKAANMWVVTDISSANLNGGNANYTAFKNNGLFFIPTAGQHSGTAFQFASGPCECELTGPSWTPDETTLFLAIQHPGEVNGTRAAARGAEGQQLAVSRPRRAAAGGGADSPRLTNPAPFRGAMAAHPGFFRVRSLHGAVQLRSEADDQHAVGVLGAVARQGRRRRSVHHAPVWS